MRVLQLIDSLPLAGAEVLVKDMAPRFGVSGVWIVKWRSCAGLTARWNQPEAVPGVPLHLTGAMNL